MLAKKHIALLSSVLVFCFFLSCSKELPPKPENYKTLYYGNPLDSNQLNALLAPCDSNLTLDLITFDKFFAGTKEIDIVSPYDITVNSFSNYHIVFDIDVLFNPVSMELEIPNVSSSFIGNRKYRLESGPGSVSNTNAQLEIYTNFPQEFYYSIWEGDLYCEYMEDSMVVSFCDIPVVDYTNDTIRINGKFSHVY